MSAPTNCESCGLRFRKANHRWPADCRSCGGRHTYCLVCVLLWGERLEEERDGAWAGTDLCPDEARAAAALMGINLGGLTNRVWEAVGDEIDISGGDPGLGTGIGGYLHSGAP